LRVPAPPAGNIWDRDVFLRRHGLELVLCVLCSSSISSISSRMPPRLISLSFSYRHKYPLSSFGGGSHNSDFNY
jgi:hypothetical protein